MSNYVDVQVRLEDYGSASAYRRAIGQVLGLSDADEIHYALVRRSLDARSRHIKYNLRFRVSLGQALPEVEKFRLKLQDVSKAQPIIIVGCGPAGMFCALRLIEFGFKPIVLERGKDVRQRRFDVAAINRGRALDLDSNYCFGEGGAGTFSDGKLYTRATKRGSPERVLNVLVFFGASESILIDAHPHIGSNKLPNIIQAMREAIQESGGEVLFQTKMQDLIQANGEIKGIRTSGGDILRSRAVVLATGHSARDVYLSLLRAGLSIEKKHYAVGVRVEYQQSHINKLQYGFEELPENLPPASFSLVSQCSGRGVFSFCMCPGGIICPAATSHSEVVVNGWSPSNRNSKYANSGIVVEVKPEDLHKFGSDNVLSGVEFQSFLEQRAFELGGGNLVAPAQRLTDFVSGKASSNLPPCSYHPGVHAVDLQDLFPQALYSRLQDGFKSFEQKRRGFITEEAIVLAVESRTSSPIRVPRDNTTYMHPACHGLFPAGEGAGYAGGIMSAAIDGENVAMAIKGFLAG